MARAYQREVRPLLEPYEPIELARQTEDIVCDGGSRKYTRFGCAGVYGGIATGYCCGCCLRCVFCWVSRSRDFPEKYGNFYSAEEAFRQLSRVARRNGVDQLRISGGEPTLCRRHLIELLERVEGSDFSLFILETNGILLGEDPDYARKIARFDKVHVRVSLKAGTPGAFRKKTGAREEAFDLPFRAIENLLEAGASFHVASMTADSRIVSPEERTALLGRLEDMHPELVSHLEEERVDPYSNTLQRLKKAGIQLEWQ